MRERDQSRHLAVGAGAPSDPDPDAADESSDPGGNGRNGHTASGEHPEDREDGGHDEDGADGTSPEPHTANDVVQAVADFLDDLIDDPTFAQEPPQPRNP